MRRDEDDDDFEEDERREMAPTEEQVEKATDIAKTHDDDQLATAIRYNVEQLNLMLLAAAQKRLNVELGTGRWSARIASARQRRAPCASRR